MHVKLNSQHNPNFGLRLQNSSKVPIEIKSALICSGLESSIDEKYPHAKAEYKIEPDCEKFVITLGTHLKGQAKPYNSIVFKVSKYIKNESTIVSKIFSFDFNQFEKDKEEMLKYMKWFIQTKNNKKIKRFLKKM
ncbi:MAG: hypothetical protein MJ237_03805 [bacterium]|nr:hypothetical protein [bacterium]